MKGLSKKEIKVVSWLEFHKKYFFTTKDIEHFFQTNYQKYNFIKGLVHKKRIIKLNRNKYYLVPIKAKSGLWREHPFIIADEICNSKNYFIGGYAAANYWKLTEQLPVQIDIYTTRRQGKINILGTKLVFHRTTNNRIENATQKEIETHIFTIESKKDSKKWIQSKT